MEKFTTHYFNTGVKPWNSNGLRDGEVWINNEKHVAFDCNAPENATLMYLCNNPKLEIANAKNVKVFEVYNTSLCSKYAYFRMN